MVLDEHKLRRCELRFRPWPSALRNWRPAIEEAEWRTIYNNGEYSTPAARTGVVVIRTQLLLLHENERRSDRLDTAERAPCTTELSECSKLRAMAAFTWPRLGAALRGLAMALLHTPR